MKAGTQVERFDKGKRALKQTILLSKDERFISCGPTSSTNCLLLFTYTVVSLAAIEELRKGQKTSIFELHKCAEVAPDVFFAC